MFSKLHEAISLLIRHFILFSAIILTVWLPGNLLLGWLDSPLEDDDGQIIKYSIWIESFFGPIYVGALLHALAEIKRGRTPTYFASIVVGLRNWFPMFAARFVAGLYILLGLIALIIPGLVLAIRYSLVDSAVLFEGAGPRDARLRSTRLTEGKRWQIAALHLIIVFTLFVAAVFLYLPGVFIESLNNKAVDFAIECAGDIIYGLLPITLFLYYWEAAGEEGRSAENFEEEQETSGFDAVEN